MYEFAPKEEFFRSQQRRARLDAVPIVLVAVVVETASSSGFGFETGLAIAAVVALGLMVVMLVVTPLAAERTRWSGFRIVVHPDAIQAIRRPRSHDITIQEQELVSVQEVSGRGLVLRGRSKHQVIEAPLELDGYAQLRDLVSRWRKPEMVSFDMMGVTGSWLGAALAIGLLWGLFQSESKVVALASASIGLVILVAFAWSVSGNPYALRTQRVVMWALSFVWLAYVLFAASRVW